MFLLVLRVLPSRLEGNDVETQEARELAARRAEELRQRWAVVYGADQVRVASDVLFTDLSTAHPNFAGPAVGAYLADLDDQPTDVHLLGGRHPTNPRAGGHGVRGRSVIYDQHLGTVQLSWHETGHSRLGSHTGAFDPHGEIEDYGGDDMMARRDVRPCAPTLDQLLDGPGDGETLEAGDGGAVRLYPLEADPLEIQGGGANWLRLNCANGDSHFLALRRWGGPWLPNKTTALQHHVLLGRDNRQPGRTSKVELEPLKVGQALSLDGFEIRYTGFDAERALVEVNGSAGRMPDRKFSAVGSPLTAADAGPWFDPQYPGQGFMVCTNGRRLSLGWFTFGVGNGPQMQRWYSCAGDMDGALEIYTTSGDRVLEHVGEGSVRKIGDELFFQAVTREHGRISQRLVRLAPESEDWVCGHWHDPARAYEGVLTHSWLKDGVRHLLAYWFGYGAAVPPVAGQSPDPRSTQRWRMIHLTAEEGDEMVGPEFEVTGGAFMHPRPFAIEESAPAIVAEAYLDEDQLWFSRGKAANGPLERLL